MQQQELRKGSFAGLAFWLIAATLLPSASAQVARKGKPEPLMIQEQGSFAVGGSVTTAPGTFDPIRQGAYNPAGLIRRGRRCTATTLTSSIRSR